MKILFFDLKAYGPFTDKPIDLLRGDKGFNIIYGPNEAGKSSALRAIRALLYGIPDRTPEATFIHEGQKLRLGARIKHSDGAELTFQRRKGRTKTLLADNGEPLGDQELDKFLGGIDETLFSKMFGINYNDLVLGGKEIIEGHGNVGESIFAAGLGKGGLRTVLSELEDEADELFNPQGRKKYIHNIISEFQEAKKEIQNTSLSSRDWETHQQNLKEAREQKDETLRSLKSLNTELIRLKRIKDSLPVIGELKENRNKRSLMGYVLILPSEFPQKRREALQALNRAKYDAEKAQNHIHTHRTDLDQVLVPEHIIAKESVIKELQQRLGIHLKAKNDLSSLTAKRDQLLADAQIILRNVRPDLTIENAESIRLTLNIRKHLQDLISRNSILKEKQNSAAKSLKKITGEADQIKRDLGELGTKRDMRVLHDACKTVLKHGDIEKQLKEAEQEYQVSEEQANIELGKLTLWTKDLISIETLAVPSAETINKFDSLLSERESKLKSIRESTDGIQAKIKELTTNIESLKFAGEVPTEEDLMNARDRRQTGWALVRKAWLEGISDNNEWDTYASGMPLDAAFEKSVEATDEISDRLRREASRVEKKAAWLATVRQYQEDISGYQDEEKKISREIKEIWRQWEEIWLPLGTKPLTPIEMRAWLNNQINIVQLSAKVRSARLKMDQIKKEIEDAKARLLSAFSSIGESGLSETDTLGKLIDTAQTILTASDETERKRDVLEKTLQRLKKQLKDASDENEDSSARLAQWEDEWSNAIKGLVFHGPVTPSTVNAFIERVQELFEKIDEAAKLNDRINGIQRDAEQFHIDVSSTAEVSAPDLLEVSVEQAAAKLDERCKGARENEVRRKELLKKIREKEDDLRDANDTIKENIAILDHLKEQAKCKSYDEMEKVERQSSEACVLDIAISQLEKQLLPYTAGGTITELIEEASRINPDDLPLSIEQTEKEIDELNKQISALDQKIGGEEKELEKMDGNSRAAEAAENAQSVLAQLREGVERYVRIKLAAEILRDEIERYRLQHQGPILKRASEIFSAITLGAFSMLKTDYDSNDKPVLIGVRPSGKETGVEGMSDGTSDQLYLSLRLASLEMQLKSGEPLPFIVDDILVNFDDERSAATLKILAELSGKTQIIFFTHHQHLVDVARKVVAPEVLFIHSL
ncbi:MAG: AAA family ATPase [Nitrospirota bacterium]